MIKKQGTLTDDLVNGIVVIECDKRKPTFLARLLVRDDIDTVDLAKLSEVLPEVSIVDVLLDATDEHLLHRHAGIRTTRLLAQQILNHIETTHGQRDCKLTSKIVEDAI